MEDAKVYGHSICDNNAEEDYIELEVIDSSNSTISLFHFKKIFPSPPEVAKSSEFEFQMLPSFIDRDITSISTADELFYNGKLLPLDHLPLHNNSINRKSLHVSKKYNDFELAFSTPFLRSCHVSSELNQENYFFEYSTRDESSKFLHVSKSFDDFGQSFSTPFCQSCNVCRELNPQDYYFEYSTNDENSKGSKFVHVSKSFDDFKQSFSTPFFQSCHVSRKLNQEDYSRDDESTKGSKSLHVSKSFDDFKQSFSTPFFQSCHVSRKLNQEDYSRDDESTKGSKSLHVSKSFDDFKQSFSTPFFQSCHVSRKLNQEDYSRDDERTKGSKSLHVSKSFDDFKQSFRIPFYQSCHVSGELNNQEDYFFGYSTDDESSRKSKWSLTRKIRLIKQLSFDHSKLKSSKVYIKCLINNSVNKLVAKKEFFGKFHHRKSSLSGAIKKLLTTTKSSSSPSSSVSRSKNSNGNIQEMHLLMRNRDVYGEVDPIEAAIAHCKNSQKQKYNSRKSSVSDIGLGSSLSASKMITEEQERARLCRG